MILKYTALAAGTALAAIVAGPAYAQSNAQVQVYNMPSQPLGGALKHLANTANIQILFSNADVDGKQAPALNGRFTTDEALRHLLAGSGLAHQNAGLNVVVVRGGGVRQISAQMEAPQPRSTVPVAEPAVAPSASEPAAPGLEDIIVTAQKRAENLQETPLAISAVTQQTIEARSISSVANLGSIAPSLVVSTATGAPLNAGLFIRGLGTNDPLLTADSPVGLYVDGVIIARSAGSAFEIADLERVEVLRGPQGTLYGRNTIGGAVNLITRKPDETFGVRQKFSVGNYGFLQSRTVVDTGELGDSGLRAAFIGIRPLGREGAYQRRCGYAGD